MTKDSLIMRLSNTDMRESANTVMACLNIIQDRPKDTQIMSIALLYLCLCSRYDLHPPEALNYADNLMRKATSYNQATFEGVKAYMKNELED